MKIQLRKSRWFGIAMIWTATYCFYVGANFEFSILLFLLGIALAAGAAEKSAQDGKKL